MKIVHIVNSDIKGGAARAAYSINSALRKLGVDSAMLVQNKLSRNESVHNGGNSFLDRNAANARIILDLIPMYLYTKMDLGRFSFGDVGVDISKRKIIKEADIIHFHWINEGFLSIESISKLKKLKKPVFWTLHDMWAFTGGCHYSGGCKRYLDCCGQCPYLRTSSEKDFSRKIWKKKSNAYNGINFNIVTCSRWLGECAKESRLLNPFPVTPVPNPFDTEVYRPGNKTEARRCFNLPEDKKLILFGSMNIKEERKGFRQLKESLIELIKTNPGLKDSVELLVFGLARPEDISDIPVKANLLGRLKNEKEIIDCYNAADLFVAPSLEDNLPNTVMESLACGTPVAAFNIGGMPDMIDHQQNGFLALPYSVTELAAGIKWILEDEERYRSLQQNARYKIVNNFTPDIVGKKYIDLYSKALQAKGELSLS